MNCPSCNTKGAYLGFTKVECPNSNCFHFEPSLAPKKNNEDAIIKEIHALAKALSAGSFNAAPAPSVASPAPSNNIPITFTIPSGASSSSNQLISIGPYLTSIGLGNTLSFSLSLHADKTVKSELSYPAYNRQYLDWRHWEYLGNNLITNLRDIKFPAYNGPLLTSYVNMDQCPNYVRYVALWSDGINSPDPIAWLDFGGYLMGNMMLLFPPNANKFDLTDWINNQKQPTSPPTSSSKTGIGTITFGSSGGVVYYNGTPIKGISSVPIVYDPNDVDTSTVGADIGKDADISFPSFTGTSP